MTMRELLAQVRKQEERIEWLEGRVRELVETRELAELRSWRVFYGADPKHICKEPE